MLASEQCFHQFYINEDEMFFEVMKCCFFFVRFIMCKSFDFFLLNRRYGLDSVEVRPTLGMFREDSSLPTIQLKVVSL
jgi:hypothetical protein